jgi:hypothetical protein
MHDGQTAGAAEGGEMSNESDGPWRYAHIGFEGDDVRIGGVAIWQSNWRRADEDAIQLPHPAHQHELHRYWIYEVGEVDRPVRFAAGELSPNVWGFYKPDRT